MKIFVMTTTIVETKPGGKTFTGKPELFTSEEEAVNYIESLYPSYSDTTQKLKEQMPWREDIPRTLFVEIPRYDSDGEWDYSTEYTFEIQEMDVRGRMK